MATDDDIDDWSARVAGRGDTGGAPDGVPELRQAIRRADEAAARAGADDRLGLERLMRRLESEGLLAGTSAATPRPKRMPVWLAAAASVAVAVIGLRLLMPAPETGPAPEPGPRPPPVETSRGFAGVVKQTFADPEAAAREVERELAALGLASRRVPAEGRVIVEVDVPQVQLDTFHAWVEPRGGRAVAPGRYRVILEPAS